MRTPFWSAGLTLVCLLLATPGMADDSAAAAIADKFARASAGAATPVGSPQSAPAATDPAAEIEAAARAEHDRRAALEAQREAETLRLAERLRESRRAKAEALDREERERLLAAKSASPGTPAASAAPIEPTAQAATQVPASTPTPKLIWPSPSAAPLTTIRRAADTHVTILLSMMPGAYGIRRFNRSQADPVLCLGETCYISNGPDLAAKPMPRRLALGMGNVLGARAGACKLQLTCIFRDVELPTGSAEFQPVDLHIVSHDVREVGIAAPDTSCAVSNGRLTCLGQIKSATYRALVVPEATARIAGGPALRAKLADGLGQAITAAR